ncbi:transporter [Acetobacter orientalis]|uniref:EamA family transporter n=1 Tax=Acetobacter orientalis TaxID=146474 RepID=UPI000B71F398|nr:EamA family transporter [Acetobacter orientalis]OUJ17634.1 transporter [Acetobacter orientalis]
MSISANTQTASLQVRIAALAQLIGGMVFLQFGSSTAKALFPIFGAAGMVALRCGFAALILMSIFKTWHVLSWRLLRLAFPYGMAIATMNLCFYLALERIPLGITVTLEFTGPLFLAFLGSRRLSDIAWLAVTVLGLFLLLNPTGANAPNLLGLMFALGAAFSWALYLIFGKRLIGKIAPGHACALGQLCGELVLFIPCFLPALIAGAGHPSSLFWAVVVAVCSSALPYALEMRAMQHLSARDLGLLCSLEPVCATLAGVLILHETLPLLRLCGIVLIAGASIGTVLTPGKKAPLAEVPEAPQ